MNLTKFSDYSLRMLLYLALHPDRPSSVAEISRAYNVSPHLLVKVAQRLIEQGYVASVRGRNGGLTLNRRPEEIKVGSVIRVTEPHWDLVECFDASTNTCPIDGACGLKGALREAQQAFLRTLDQRTLAEFLPKSKVLVRLLTAEAARAGAPLPR
jgi:Rrf2 family nitric oxide-sensitive transcriptional repressor